MTQNKVLPGAYINFVSRPRAMGSLGERGVVCVGMELDWGREGMTDIAAAEGRTNCRELFGYTYLSEEMKDLRELFAHAKEVKLYRLNGGEKARMTQDGLTVTAKYPGKRGNDICIKIGISGCGREGGLQCTGIQRRGRENKKAVCEFYEADARGGRRKICDGAA